jgi:hypothetical protein
MSQLLGAFGLLDFTMLRPFLAWHAFWNLWNVYFFNFQIFISGRGEMPITETTDAESVDTGAWLCLIFWKYIEVLFGVISHEICRCLYKRCRNITCRTVQHIFLNEDRVPAKAYCVSASLHNITFHKHTSLNAIILLIYLLTYCMEQSPSWEANRFAASQEITAFYATRRIITAFTSARHLSVSLANPI